MIKYQKSFDLQTEEKDLIIVLNELETTKAVLSVFEEQLNDMKDELFTTVYTLGKLKSKRIHLIGAGKLTNDSDLKKVVAKISDLNKDAVVLTSTFNEEELKQVSYLVERVMVKRYVIDTFKSKKSDPKSSLFFYGEEVIEAALNEGVVYAESINKAKDLVNAPYNYMKAKDIAEYAKTFSQYKNVEVKIYEKSEIEAMNMGAFLGVNKGSSDAPYLIFVEYKGNDEEPTALVGKGVMFDTGGYSLKPSQSMPNMKTDMAGAAAVLAAFEGIAKLQADAHVMAIVAATDNRIGDDAIVPDDILTSANGKTIEIVSTDAEGRLTLADAVWFAQKQGAKKIIDVATLTGAIVAALGEHYTGAFTNDQAYLNDFKMVSDMANEKIWQMPLSKEFHDEIKSKVADLSNKGGRLAGSSIAAAFIEEFINPDTKWIHLDIAGTSSNKNEGATGVMVKSFIKLFHN